MPAPDSTWYAEGVLENSGADYYTLAATDSSPYLAGLGAGVSPDNIAALTDIKDGVERYAGSGTYGSYPTTLTTQTADKDAIEAAVLDTDGTDSTISLPNAINATAGTALVYAAGAAAGGGIGVRRGGALRGA
jgi:hypothetical protein